MKRFTKSMFLAAIVLLMVVSSAFAAGHKSIVDIAVEDGRFDTLVAAVVYTDLAEALSGGEWTVFAPTDDAFDKLGLNEKNITSAFSKAELTDILLYHALEGEVNSDKALSLVGDVTMANGQKAGLKAFKGDLFVNDDSKVIIPDVLAANGVIHVVDTVILGPWPRGEEDVAVGGGDSDEAAGNSIVDIAVNNGNFDTLVAAVVYAGLADALSGGEWTVFAPTDDAFAAALEALGISAEELLASPDLAGILTYHVVAGKLMAADVLAAVEAGNGTAMVETVNGASITVELVDGNVVIDGTATVAVVDLEAGNGVVHV
ncbi:MAG TPA: fasciclin domain-containing protein, partial [Anaerolineae bacterium]|nr:fasciclin domain-containing protein [Anaerolineae bacterium]